jgi:Alkylmercury lyase
VSQAADTAVRLEVYRFFIDRGRPPVPAEIAEAVGTDQASVEDSLRRLAEGHVLVLAPGTPYIWMANPFSAIPTPFSVEANGRTWFGNCIWDGLGIVAMVGGNGSVKTWCPDCGERLTVSVRDHESSSGEGVVHFAIPAARWWDDIGFN